MSETFPLETRTLAIAIFYALGDATGMGGIVGPWLFGTLIQGGKREDVFVGYPLASLLMIGAALIHARRGVAAERKPLEQIAGPLSFAD